MITFFSCLCGNGKDPVAQKISELVEEDEVSVEKTKIFTSVGNTKENNGADKDSECTKADGETDESEMEVGNRIKYPVGSVVATATVYLRGEETIE